MQRLRELREALDAELGSPPDIVALGTTLEGVDEEWEAAAPGDTASSGLERETPLLPPHAEIPAPTPLPTSMMRIEALDLGMEALEGLDELQQLGDPYSHWGGVGGLLYREPRRATSVTWWASDSETVSEPETFTEYTLDSEDTSVSSTRASTSATGTAASGSITRRGGFSVVVRGARSPHTRFGDHRHGGFRGRSMTRRERRTDGTAAMRHRHPTHTPSRGPNPRRAPEPLMMMMMAHHRHPRHPIVPHHRTQIGRVREEAAEGGL